MTTGTLAREAGVHVETLRYYERRGLLPAPARRPSGYRQYPPDAVRRVRFIKGAQELGFTLKEIGELLGLNDGEGLTCGKVVAAAEEKREQIREKIERLTAMQSVLANLIRRCPRRGRKAACPIVECFEHYGVPRSVARGERNPREGRKEP